MQRQVRALRPARTNLGGSQQVPGTVSTGKFNVLIVDLNNFASFPTLAIGLLTASLRNQGHQVEVLCPLAHDVPAVQRERQETWIDHARRRIHLSDWFPVLGLRDILRKFAVSILEAPHPVVLREVAAVLERKPDAILVSAYLQHYNSVKEIGRLAAGSGVPLLLGGPMFNIPEVAEYWSGLAGVTAVVGAEMDRDLSALVESLCKGEDLLRYRGLILPDGRKTPSAPALRMLDQIPIPDFTDFPWDRYPVRIIPVMTGRGCQWDECLFCSDVISTSGRSFRTRSVESVLQEMQEQAQRHNTRSFLFLDLKLNSRPDMIRGIAAGIGRLVQGAEWVGTVHVDQRRDNGLSAADLNRASEGGMRRISFGLETGSQRLLDLMRKGSTVERNAAFIRDAHNAGLSIRCTMFKGFPGETTDDMTATADFLERHAEYLDRVRFNDFSLQIGTPIWKAMRDKTRLDPASTDDILVLQQDDRRARSAYRHSQARDRAYRRAKARALAVVYAINRRPLRNSARQFDGLM